MFRIGLLLSFFLFFPIPAFAQDNIDQAYLEMVQQSYQMPADFDFGKVRELYSKASFYKPYGLDPKLSFKDYFQRQKDNDPGVLDDVEKFVHTHFALPEMHSRAMSMFKESNPEKAAYHAWATRGLMKAVYGSHKALSKDDAIKVLIISEEYLASRQVGDVKGQRIEQADGKVFDVLTVVSKKSGKEMDMWFDTTYLFSVKDPF